MSDVMIDEFHNNQKTDAMTQDKEIKVRIPLDHHVRLHTAKVVSGAPISETVREALSDYFAQMREKDAARQE